MPVKTAPAPSKPLSTPVPLGLSSQQSSSGATAAALEAIQCTFGHLPYRLNLAADIPKGTKVYDRYDPTAGEKFPQAADGTFLGPREVVRALNDLEGLEVLGLASCGDSSRSRSPVSDLPFIEHIVNLY
jgi:hypothetical protein